MEGDDKALAAAMLAWARRINPQITEPQLRALIRRMLREKKERERRGPMQ